MASLEVISYVSKNYINWSSTIQIFFEFCCWCSVLLECFRSITCPSLLIRPKVLIAAGFLLPKTVQGLCKYLG
uniref:Uncharacterized protein n=1 Tax=Lepeophtheirus salmonis TaxID=72036 RepID=A0A0K2VKB6_LEPSM